MADVRKQKKIGKGKKPSALKRTRQAKKRHAQNLVLRSRMRTEIKRLRTCLATKNKEEAQKLLSPTTSTIAKMVNKGILHKNTAARTISRLTRQFNQL